MRRDERYPVASMLSCKLGEVLDLSGSGMRVRSTGKPQLKRGQVVALTLRAGDKQLRVTTQAVRLRRLGFRSWEIGLRFVELRPSVQAALKTLARFGFIPKSKPDIDYSADADAGVNAPPQPSPQVAHHYCVLGVTPEATPEQIRAAYRALARQYHPDVNKSEDAAEHFKQVHEAYAVLKSKSSGNGFGQFAHHSAGDAA